MSKGNLFQGQGRGKVGDVVFTVRNGEQIARVRNRHPYNPRSPRQLVQRAIMATVSLAYSSGKDIFDHSFQGKPAGDACARYFLKRNATKLRADIADQLTLTPQEASACVVNYNPLYPVANAYMVSEGTLPNPLEVLFVNTGASQKTFRVAGKWTNEGYTTLADLANAQFNTNDLFTIVAFVVTSQSHSNALFTCHHPNMYTRLGDWCEYSTFPTQFCFIRFAVKASAFTSTKLITGTGDDQAHWGDLFEITDYKGEALESDTDIIDQIMDGSFVDGFDIDGFFKFPAIDINVRAHGCASMAIIRSRVNQDLRSTEYMLTANNDGRQEGSRQAPGGCWGLVAPIVLQSWQQGITEIGDSDLILEGGDDA